MITTRTCFINMTIWQAGTNGLGIWLYVVLAIPVRKCRNCVKNFLVSTVCVLSRGRTFYYGYVKRWYVVFLSINFTIVFVLKGLIFLLLWCIIFSNIGKGEITMKVSFELAYKAWLGGRSVRLMYEGAPEGL